MLRLLKVELFKLSKNKTFKVICIIAAVLSIATIISQTTYMREMFGQSLAQLSPEQQAQLLEASAVPTIGMGMSLSSKVREIYYTTFGSGLIEIFIAILVGALLAKEYTDETFKNSLAYGLSRTKVYIAKFLALVFGTAVVCAILSGIPTIGITIMNGWGEPFEIAHLGSMLLVYLMVVIVAATVVALVMILAILIKSNGATIGITLGSAIVLPSLLSFFYNKNEAFDFVFEKLPYLNMKTAMSLTATTEELVTVVVISLIYIVIAVGIGQKIFNAQDIK